MNELVAGLADPHSAQLGSYLGGVRRLADRSLRTHGHIVMPAEAQAYSLLFGEDLQDHKDAIQKLADCALTAANVADIYSEPSLYAHIRAIAQAVAAQEEWFANHFSTLARELREATLSQGGSVGRELRAHIRSGATLRADAEATVTRALARSGREPPVPLPEALVTAVETTFRAGFAATALALERVCCDGASMSKDKNRNLLWDQEIAHNLGHEIGSLRILVVTDDGFFDQAAERAGFPDSVVTPRQYLAMLASSDAA